MNGLFLLNKSNGLSSNQALQKVKRLFKAKKAGHTGSLDPIATGVLPICFGEATKFAQSGLDAIKGYETIGQLGIATDTGDRTGEIVATQGPPQDLSKEAFEQILAEFIGVQKQIPSIYSALKYQGRPLYEYARKGIEVPRPERDICIGSIQLLNFDTDTGRFSLRVLCSKGTYIRTLLEDIGSKIGCGAHVVELHRTTAGLFTQNHTHTYDSLLDLSFEELCDLQIPASSLLVDYPWFYANERASKLLDNGHKVEQVDCVAIDELKFELDLFAESNLQTPQILKDFTSQQQLEKKIQSPYVIFSSRINTDLPPQHFDNLRLRGLVLADDGQFQPKRLVNKDVQLL